MKGHPWQPSPLPSTDASGSVGPEPRVLPSQRPGLQDLQAVPGRWPPDGATVLGAKFLWGRGPGEWRRRQAEELKGSEVPIRTLRTCQWLLGQEVPQGYRAGWG